MLRASAGTGKTTVLTERYLRLIEFGVPPRHILALTFTRKAAQEMKDRIVAALGSSAGRGDLAEVGVSTLDAFTLGLIREFPLDAGVNPGIEVLDERSIPVVQTEAIERVLSGATGFDRERLADLPLLLERSSTQVERAVRNYLDRRVVWRRNFAQKAREVGDPAAPRLRSSFREVSSACERLRTAGEAVGIPLRVRLALRLEEQSGARDALDRETLERFFRLKTPPKTLPAELKPDYETVRAKADEFRSRWLDFQNDRALGPVWQVFQAVEAEYQRLKAERGVMDFDDLTVAATRLLENLGEFSESRFRLEARYHHLLLDEFHDTSDHQWRLLQAIIRPWSEGAGLTAEGVRRVTKGRLSHPTIFVVGDRKQSIYRFRDARVEIVKQAEEVIRALRDPEREPPPGLVLRWNFRSIRRLRRFVNSVSNEISEDREAEEKDWAFLYDDSDRLPENEGPADQRPVLRPALSIAVAETHEQAAERIAARIRVLVEKDGVHPGEIALLARVTSNLPIYRAAVERLGIPTWLMKGAGFFDTSEVRDLRALCRFLARPYSDRRAVELLRSRFFALPGDDLARLRRASPAATPFADLLRSGGEGTSPELDSASATRLRTAASVVSPWISLSRRLPPSRAVARILEETRYLEAAEAANRQQAANIRKALQHLRALERGGFAGMERIAEGLAAAAQGDTTQAPVEAAGAVQALSIHAAKGLEFEQVFLVDCGNQGAGDPGIPRVQERGNGRWTIALIKDASPWKMDDGGRSRSEERRCLYVAMTRAKRGLTLSWTVKFNKPKRGEKKGRPRQPKGLARFLPAELFRAASETARNSTGFLDWVGHEIEVLPAPPA